MTLTSASSDSERIEVDFSDCRKLEVYYQCRVNGLNIMESDKRMDVRINVNSQQPNDVRIESSNMTFIPPQFFEKLVDLKEFVAINCSIRNIFQDTFTSAFKLHYLVLSHNNIIFIADNAFKNVSDLQSLKLDNNEIESLTTNVFRGLNMLRTLKLAFNKIAYLPLFIFHDLESLETLELNNNFIRVLSAEQFSNNKALQQIDLSNNLITIIDNETFDDLINIRQLSLENNVCVNACITSRDNATINGMLKCCMTSSEEMRSCLAMKNESVGGSINDSGSGMGITSMLFLFVSVFGNLALIMYLVNNRAWIERLRNREEAIELVSAEVSENAYQVF